MSHDEKLADRPDGSWTKPDIYIAAMARKRGYRRSRGERTRTQPEFPRLLLSTLPFVALFGLLAILAVAIAIVAFPGNQPAPKPKQPVAHEQGVAERGWFQEAQKQFHR